MSLLERTASLLESATANGLSLRQIAPDGGPVEYEWLKKFSAGKISDPSVNRIEALHKRLADLVRSAA